MTITKAQLQRIYPNARELSVDTLLDGINRAMEERDITTPLRQAHFLAQIGHESGELRYREEIASGSAYEGRRDLGNTQSGDGRRFKGRGLIQLTGRYNYEKYSRAVGRQAEIMEDPALIANDDFLTVDVAAWYWDTRDLNKHADRDDVLTVTKLINGGTRGLDDRKRLLKSAKKELQA